MNTLEAPKTNKQRLQRPANIDRGLCSPANRTPSSDSARPPVALCVSSDSNGTMIPVTRTTRKALHSSEQKSYLRHPKSLQALQLSLFISIVLLFVSHLECATATPVPSISSPGPSPKQEVADTSSSIAPGVTSSKPAGQEQSSTATATATGGGGGGELLDDSNAIKQVQAGKTNTAEKLKRGLTNFMNQLNPAPFFVPTIQPQQHLAGGSALSKAAADKAPSQPNTLSAEPATIVNSDSSLVIKGPANRWAFARPIGGPLRWG